MLIVFLRILQFFFVSLLMILFFNVWFGEWNDVVGVCYSGFDDCVQYFDFCVRLAGELASSWLCCLTS